MVVVLVVVVVVLVVVAVVVENDFNCIFGLFNCVSSLMVMLINVCVEIYPVFNTT